MNIWTCINIFTRGCITHLWKFSIFTFRKVRTSTGILIIVGCIVQKSHRRLGKQMNYSRRNNILGQTNYEFLCRAFKHSATGGKSNNKNANVPSPGLTGTRGGGNTILLACCFCRATKGVLLSPRKQGNEIQERRLKADPWQAKRNARFFFGGGLRLRWWFFARV